MPPEPCAPATPPSASDFDATHAPQASTADRISPHELALHADAHGIPAPVPPSAPPLPLTQLARDFQADAGRAAGDEGDLGRERGGGIGGGGHSKPHLLSSPLSSHLARQDVAAKWGDGRRRRHGGSVAPSAQTPRHSRRAPARRLGAPYLPAAGMERYERVM